jgi:hypothetical protein
MTPEQSIESFVDKNFDRETAFLAELVKVPPLPLRAPKSS